MADVKVPRTEDFCAYFGLPQKLLRKEVWRRNTADVYWSYEPSKKLASDYYGTTGEIKNILGILEASCTDQGLPHNQTVTKELFNLSRGLKGRCHPVEASTFALASGLLMPVRPTLLFRCEARRHHLLWLQPTKGWPIFDSGLSAMKKICRIGFRGSDYEDLDIRVVDLAARQGTQREVKDTWLSDVDEMSDAEFSAEKERILNTLHEVARDLKGKVEGARDRRSEQPPLLQIMRGGGA